MGLSSLLQLPLPGLLSYWGGLGSLFLISMPMDTCLHLFHKHDTSLQLFLAFLTPPPPQGPAPGKDELVSGEINPEIHEIIQL